MNKLEMMSLVAGPTAIAVLAAVIAVNASDQIVFPKVSIAAAAPTAYSADHARIPAAQGSDEAAPTF